MSDVPPPPPPSDPGWQPPPPAYSAPIPAVRPGVVTAAAVVLFVLAGFHALVALLALLGSAAFAGFGHGALSAIALVIALVYLAIAGVDVFAGTQILQQRRNGRTLGLVIGAIGLLFSLFALRHGTGVLSLVLYGFVLWSLWTNEAAFTR